MIVPLGNMCTLLVRPVRQSRPVTPQENDCINTCHRQLSIPQVFCSSPIGFFRKAAAIYMVLMLQPSLIVASSVLFFFFNSSYQHSKHNGSSGSNKQLAEGTLLTGPDKHASYSQTVASSLRPSAQCPVQAVPEGNQVAGQPCRSLHFGACISTPDSVSVLIETTNLTGDGHSAGREHRRAHPGPTAELVRRAALLWHTQPRPQVFSDAWHRTVFPNRGQPGNSFS